MLPLLLSAAHAVTLSASPAVPGHTIVLSVSGSPGETVSVAHGPSAGSGPCYPVLNGACLGITSPTRIGTVTLDSNGEGELYLGVPGNTPFGVSRAFQAMAHRAGAPWEGSNVVRLTTRAAAVVPDLDGWLLGGTLSGSALVAASVGMHDLTLHVGGVAIPLATNTTASRFQVNLPLSGGTDAAARLQLTAVSNGATTYSTPFAIGAVLGCYWDGAQEQLARFDVLTGNHLDVGVVGDLAWWSGQTVLDDATDTFYVFGTNNSSVNKLYALDAVTGSFLGETVLTSPAPARTLMRADGEILGIQWNGTFEEFGTLDPATGAFTYVGQVDDLMWWSGQAVYDAATDRLLVWGNDGTQDERYLLDATTGALISTTAGASPGIGLQLRSDGMVLGFRWNGSEEEMVAFDPVTGTTTVTGIVDDLAWWSGQTLLDEAAGVIYVWGNDGTQNELYTLDPWTGALLGTVATGTAGAPLGMQMQY